MEQGGKVKKSTRAYILIGILSTACLATGGVSFIGLRGRRNAIEEMKWELERVRLRVKDLVAKEDDRQSQTAPKWKIVRESNISEVLEWIEISAGSSEVTIDKVLTTEQSEFGRFEFSMLGHGALPGIVKFLAILEEFRGGLVLQDLIVSAVANSKPTFKLQVASYYGSDGEDDEEDR